MKRLTIIALLFIEVSAVYQIGVGNGNLPATLTLAKVRQVGNQPCDSRALRRMTPKTYNRALIVKLITCAEKRFPVQGGRAFALCVAQRESGMWPYAVNPSGSAGLFQVIPSTWQSWWRSYPRVRRWILRARHGSHPLDAYSNAMLSIRAMHDSENPWAGGRYSC